MVVPGFSPVGFLFLLMLLVPNLLWAKRKPAGYERAVVREAPLLLWLERIGEIAVTTLALFFSRFPLRPLGPWSLWLGAAVFLLLMYELYWLRYFRGNRTMEDFYRSFLGVPVPGASLPVAAFFCFALYGRSLVLGAAVVLLGIGHIGIHLGHLREIAAPAEPFSKKRG